MPQWAAPDELRQHEQALMRIGRRLQALGQLLEQDPSRLVAKGFEFDSAITGAHPVEVEMDQLRALFDVSTDANIGRLLADYQLALARRKSAT